MGYSIRTERYRYTDVGRGTRAGALRLRDRSARVKESRKGRSPLRHPRKTAPPVGNDHKAARWKPGRVKDNH